MVVMVTAIYYCVQLSWWEGLPQSGARAESASADAQSADAERRLSNPVEGPLRDSAAVAKRRVWAFVYGI